MKHTPPIHILYFLEGKEFCLTEVKRTDLPQEPDKSKVYFWLFIDTRTGAVQKLDFVSMKSEKGKEQRRFVQGKLTFDSREGVFENQQGEHPLQTRPPASLPEKIMNQIQVFLQG